MNKFFNYLYHFFLDKISNRKRVHPIYILPTTDGIKVITLNLILLAIGLTYANNYILLFNFILFCLLLASMFYTHFNLQGVKFHSFKTSELYANSTTALEFIFQRQTNNTHYFLKPIIKTKGLSFDTSSFNISTNTLSVQLKVTPKKRGVFKVESIGLETRFPFNFFTCFTFFNTDINIIVYPEKKSYLAVRAIPFTLENSNEEPDVSHRLYRLGDNLKRVDWKKVAQVNRWYTKETLSEFETPIVFENEPDAPIEESLSSLCCEIQKVRNQNIIFGLSIDGKIKCSPSQGNAHVSRCLKELALHGT